jgi:hypothetical protein
MKNHARKAAKGTKKIMRGSGRGLGSDSRSESPEGVGSLSEPPEWSVVKVFLGLDGAGRWRLQGALVAYLRVQASLGEILQVPEVRRDLYHLVEQELVSETKSIGEPTTLSARMSFEVTFRARSPPFLRVFRLRACATSFHRRIVCHLRRLLSCRKQRKRVLGLSIGVYS